MIRRLDFEESAHFYRKKEGKEHPHSTDSISPNVTSCHPTATRVETERNRGGKKVHLELWEGRKEGRKGQMKITFVWK